MYIMSTMWTTHKLVYMWVERRTHNILLARETKTHVWVYFVVVHTYGIQLWLHVMRVVKVKLTTINYEILIISLNIMHCIWRDADDNDDNNIFDKVFGYDVCNSDNDLYEKYAYELPDKMEFS